MVFLQLRILMATQITKHIPDSKSVVALEVVALSDKEESIFSRNQEFFCLLSGDLAMKPTGNKAIHNIRT